MTSEKYEVWCQAGCIFDLDEVWKWGCPRDGCKSRYETLEMNWKCLLATQSCLTLCDAMDCSPSGFSVHGILQARALEQGAISPSRGSSWPRDWTWVSCIAGKFFTIWDTREAQKMIKENTVKRLQQSQRVEVTTQWDDCPGGDRPSMPVLVLESGGGGEVHPVWELWLLETCWESLPSFPFSLLDYRSGSAFNPLGWEGQISFSSEYMINEQVKIIFFSVKQPPKLGNFYLLWISKVSKDIAQHSVKITAIFLPNSFVEGDLNLKT